MLESIKRWASGWVAFFLIGLLIFSFAIWGIADYITGGGGRGALATIGDKQVTVQEFQRAFGNELNALSRQAGRRLTYEQARAVGLDGRVLSQLIGSSAVEAHADELGLALSDKAIAEGLTTDPSFQNGGTFDRNLVERLRRELGVSERGLIDLRRKDDLRNQITTALLRATVVPETMVDALSDYRGETRVISHFTLDAAKLAQPGEPTAEDLKKTYEENKRRFMTDPRRHLNVLRLTIDELKKKAAFSDAELRQAYEQTRKAYVVPEKRRIEQIAFPDLAAAQKAAEALKQGKAFAQVAKQAGSSETDIKLGLKTKDQMIDEKIAEAVFKLEKDQPSDIIEGKFITAIVRATEIQPGKEPTFEEVKDKVKDQLSNQWASAQLREYYGKIDDGRGEGKPLKEIAAELKLPYHDLKGITRGNVNSEGKPGLLVPNATDIIQAGFRGEIGLESEPIQLRDTGYAWVDVAEITDSKQKTFDQVKDDVKRLWTDRETRKILSKKAKELTEAIKSGTDFAKVAEQAGGKVETTAAVGRSTIPDGLTQAAMAQVFALRKGEVSNTETADGKSRVIFRLDEINKAPEPGKDLTERLRNELLQQLRTDSIASYIAALQERFSVDINQAQFRRVTGADQPQ
ncbi:MAG: SurA N-terminal domain-containing protein [Alphaproteobacteria bacterium]|nr:SurA N-terminal domain-containing protein [Alphaproteobacteria bacterium]